MLPELVPSGCMSMPWAFFKWWHWVDRDHFYDRVRRVSWCFCMSDSLYRIECSCICKFVLIQYILSTPVSVQDQWSSGFNQAKMTEYETWKKGPFVIQLNSDSSNVHVQPSSVARSLALCLKLPLLPYIVRANSEGFGEAHRLPIW